MIDFSRKWAKILIFYVNLSLEPVETLDYPQFGLHGCFLVRSGQEDNEFVSLITK